MRAAESCRAAVVGAADLGRWRSGIEWVATHPETIRGFATAEIPAGLWLAQQEELLPVGAGAV